MNTCNLKQEYNSGSTVQGDELPGKKKDKKKVIKEGR